MQTTPSPLQRYRRTSPSEELLRLPASAMGVRSRLMHAPPRAALALTQLAGLLEGDPALTHDEVVGLMAGLLTWENTPSGTTRLSDWLAENRGRLGTRYVSELRRNFRLEGVGVEEMSIPEGTLSKWSHHEAGTDFKEAHVPIRKTLDTYQGLSRFKYDVFLQGSYKNDTNLGGDSDVDVVVRLSSKLKPAVVALTGEELQKNGSHRFVYQHWKSFRDEALKAMRARFGSAVKSGRKTLKVPKGKIPADADLVVTVSHLEGIGFYLSDERRWVVSFPQQHHSRGLKKERATSNRFKRTVRMFKAARNRLVENEVLTKEDAPSYFIECLLYNVPDGLFTQELAPTYTGIVDWLKTAKLKDFQCQNGQVPLFGRGREQWTAQKAQAFVKALQRMWDAWG